MNVKTGHFYVCVCVCVHVRIHVQGYACLWGLCTRRSKSTSSVIPQVPPTSVCLFPCCLFETRSLFGLGIVRKSKLAGQGAPRISVSTPSAGITSVCHRTQISYIIVGSKVRSFCLQSNQVLYQLTYSSSLKTALK